MKPVETVIHNIRNYIEGLPGRKDLLVNSSMSWPKGGSRNIVLNDDLGLELGNPKQESASYLLWSENVNSITNGALTLVGPDFQESEGKSLPFGKVVLVGVDGFTEENTYDRYREMDFLRYDLDLRGFMLRAVSQHHREWCRVSKTALSYGFSSMHLSAALMEQLKGKPYVSSVQIIIITSSPEEVKKLGEIATPAIRLIAAMDKMAQEIDFDCDECGYQDVCDEAEELKNMRDRRMKKRASKEAVRG